MTPKTLTNPEVSATKYETEDRNVLFLASRGVRHVSHKRIGGKVKFLFNREEVVPLLKEFSTAPELMVDYRMIMQSENLFNTIVHEDF